MPMLGTVTLRCTCGEMRGTATGVSAATGNRLVCMCDDCQTYAHFLGRGDEILDAHGGTDIFQMTPSQLEITAGMELLRCVRLSPKGLMRWHSQCCRTPLGNTVANARMPFVGVPHLFMDHRGDGRTREEVLGPVLAKVQGRFARGTMPADAYRTAPLGLMLRSLRLLASAWLHGRHTPSPFFDAVTGSPVVEPRVLTLEERADLRQRHLTPLAR